MPDRTEHVPDQQLADALLLARRGHAYFSRKLNELRDDEFDAPLLLPGWTPRHVVGDVGCNARLVECAATGIETPMYSSHDAATIETSAPTWSPSPLAARRSTATSPRESPR